MSILFHDKHEECGRQAVHACVHGHVLTKTFERNPCVFALCAPLVMKGLRSEMDPIGGGLGVARYSIHSSLERKGARVGGKRSDLCCIDCGYRLCALSRKRMAGED